MFPVLDFSSFFSGHDRELHIYLFSEIKKQTKNDTPATLEFENQKNNGCGLASSSDTV